MNNLNPIYKYILATVWFPLPITNCHPTNNRTRVHTLASVLYLFIYLFILYSQANKKEMLTDATTTSCGCPAKPVPLPAYVPPSSEKVTVKFKLDEYHIIAQVYTEDLTLAAVIDDLARKFKLDAKFLELSHAELADGAVLDGAMRLYEVPHNEFSIIELGLGLNDGLVMEANLRAKRTSERVRLDPEVFYG